MFLRNEKGYTTKVVDVTHVVKDLVFLKQGIQVVFTCELMENQFDFEIWFTYNGSEYSVCEQAGRRELHYQNMGKPDIVHQCIFEYTSGSWDDVTFQNQKELLYRRKYGFGRSRKLFLEFVSLYKKLLSCAIENIETTFGF